jgi:hypothetical protein
MYMSGAAVGQTPVVVRCEPDKRLFEQVTWVKESVEVKPPATVLVLDATRAVAWKPHRRALLSAMVTIQCCTTPGA